MKRCKARSMVQKNTQVTVVNCGGKRKRRRASAGRCGKALRRAREREHACGRIFQQCDGTPNVYFSTADSRTSALIRVDNDTKGEMDVEIVRRNGRRMNGTVEQGQQVMFDVPYISAFQVACRGEGGICKGYYSIKLRRGGQRRCAYGGAAAGSRR